MGRKFLAALMTVLCAASLASAQTLGMEPIRLGDPDILHLLREICPDLGPGGKATHYKGVRILPDSVDRDADQAGTVDVDLGSASQAGVTMGTARRV